MLLDYSKYKDKEVYLLLSQGGKEAEAAFTELYARYSQRVFAYILRFTSDNNEAKDIFQEAFIKVFNSVSEHPAVDNVTAYIMTIVRNICINLTRDRRTVNRLEDYNLVSNDSGYEQKEFMEILASALQLLDPEIREAFILRVYHGMDYESICTITGESINVVRNRVWRAKEKIKKVLTPYMQDVL